jgi:hypothetical protein
MSHRAQHAEGFGRGLGEDHPDFLPAGLAQLRTNHSNTSTAVVLRLSIFNETQEFGKMRKQVIAAAMAIVLGIATTATGTTAFARGGSGGGGGGGGHGGGFGGGGHGFGGGGFGGHGFGMGHGGFGGRGIAINRGGFGHGRFEGRRFGRGIYAYCNPYYYPYGCNGY